MCSESVLLYLPSRSFSRLAELPGALSETYIFRFVPPTVPLPRDSAIVSSLLRAQRTMSNCFCIVNYKLRAI